MIIQWLGHSCFRVESGGYSIVLDPYRDGKIAGLRPLRVSADAVLCSHDHDDHGYVQAVSLTGGGKASPFTIRRVQSAHDKEDGARRGKNTIHVLEAEGLRVAHLGDLGTVLTRQQVEAIGPLDALMTPVGGYYTIDADEAAQVVKQLNPRLILPMHYRSNRFGFPEISGLEPFTAQFAAVEWVDSDTVRLDASGPRGVVVLSYPQE